MNSFKERLTQLLNETVETDKGALSRMDAIALAVVDKAMKGDLSCVNFIRELTGKREKGATKVQEEVVRVRIVQEDGHGA